MKRPLRFSIWYGVFALAVLVAVERYAVSLVDVETIPYSRFETALKAGEIEDVVVGDDAIHGTFKAKDASARPRRFETVRVDPAVAAQLAAAGVSYGGQASSGWLEGIVGWLLPPLVFVGIWLLLASRLGSGRGSGLMTIGKSNAKVYVEKSIPTTFADVAGVDEAKVELQEVIAFLRDPEGHGRLGAHVPKGVLLVGPPGTGKTLLARAVAGEAGVPFLSINGSEFVELFVGVGASRVRDLFERAREQAPCIIFIDELDALGRARGAMPISGGQDEKEQTLNQLLSELDGFDTRSGVVLLAATNRPEILDPALLRAGRFDRQILVDRPDKTGRLAILHVHARKVVLGGDVSLEDVAALTTGFTGADLANLVNEAALLATRRHAVAVEQRDLAEAIERIVAGLEKKTRILSASERRTIAYHEIGHALVALALPGSDRVQKVSIIPRGIAALGYTIQRPTEDRFLMSCRELGDRLAVLFGGRAAESLVFGDTSTGAADDLAKATGIARSMVLRYGMVPQIGHVSYEPTASPLLDQPADAWRPRLYGEATATTVDDAVRELLDAAFERARAILAAERAVLDRAAAALLERETLSGDELVDMLAARAQPAAALPVET
ncbi:ATP-dependent zinc metalloprotease FtsH [Dokdonella sp.]|uniref:ATP-dependent zinc metalloprotease FtsH n=1 Tax=Dokdonella sp. TaxID=2291710 RepID=UPI002F41577B